jgi:hypothetical protein
MGLPMIRPAFALLFALATTGCEKDLLAGLHDAAIDSQGPDASTRCGAPATDAHGPAKYTVFLNFDGATLTQGPDDARINQSSAIVQNPTVLTRYLDGSPEREIRINAIVNFVWKAFAPYSVDVVTTRPTSGDYLMAVISNQSSEDVGFPVGYFSVAPYPCNSGNRNLVSFEFEPEQAGNEQAYSVLSDIGSMIGLAATTKQGDCMCRVGGCDVPPTFVQCTFGTDVATYTPNNCNRTPTQDEPALMQEAWGCR